MRLRHRNPHAGRPYVRTDKYVLVSQAVLELLPESGPGLTAEEMVTGLGFVLPPTLFPRSSSIRWFLTAVRIDLEARGQIQRVGRHKPARYLARLGHPSRPERPATRAFLTPDWSAVRR